MKQIVKNLIIFDHDGTLAFYGQDSQRFDLFPGIKELIWDLKKQNFALAVWTARSKPSLQKSLNDNNLAHCFDALATTTDFPSKPRIDGLQFIKEEIELTCGTTLLKTNILHIGDSLADIEGAQHFGIDVLFVDWEDRDASDDSKFKLTNLKTVRKVEELRREIGRKFQIKI